MRYRVTCNTIIEYEIFVDADSLEEAEKMGYENMDSLPYHTVNVDVVCVEEMKE